MRKFKITVNGNSYEVEVEEIGGSLQASTPVPIASAPRAAVASKAPPARKVEVGAVGQPGRVETITSPLPGVIMSIPAKEGQTLDRGAVLLIIEAMKMENELMAPGNCKVKEVLVTVGQSVKTGDPVLTLTLV